MATPFDTTNGIYPWYNRTQNNFSSLIREIPGLYEIASEHDGVAIWKNNDARIFVLLIVGSIPAAIFGYLFQDIVEEKIRNTSLVALLLIIFALVLRRSPIGK